MLLLSERTPPRGFLYLVINVIISINQRTLATRADTCCLVVIIFPCASILEVENTLRVIVEIESMLILSITCSIAETGDLLCEVDDHVSPKDPLSTIIDAKKC